MGLLTNNEWTLEDWENKIPEPTKITPNQYYVIKRLEFLSSEAIVTYEDTMNDRLRKGDRLMVRNVEVFRKATGLTLKDIPIADDDDTSLKEPNNTLITNDDDKRVITPIESVASNSDNRINALEVQMNKLASLFPDNQILICRP